MRKIIGFLFDYAVGGMVAMLIAYGISSAIVALGFV